MMTVLVTGASGFIGRATVVALRQAGWKVRAAARAPRNVTAEAETIPLPDLSGPVDWAGLIGEATHVVHLAAVAHRGSDVPDATYEQVNRQSVADLATAAGGRVQRLVFISSVAAQTGPSSDHVLTEADAPRPTTIYGRTKLAAEEALRAASVPHTILRPVVVYGPQAPGNIAALLKLAALPVPLPLGALTARRSLLAVDNLVSAIALALDEPKLLNETFIVADRDVLSLPEIVTALRAGMGRSPGLINVPPDLFAVPLRMIGRSALWERLGGSLIVSPEKLVAAGWRPAIATRAGLAAMTAA
jgi:nucleoside-diphosphate-sugar epimerase